LKIGCYGEKRYMRGVGDEAVDDDNGVKGFIICGLLLNNVIVITAGDEADIEQGKLRNTGSTLI